MLKSLVSQSQESQVCVCVCGGGGGGGGGGFGTVGIHKPRSRYHTMILHFHNSLIGIHPLFRKPLKWKLKWRLFGVQWDSQKALIERD